MAWTYEPNRNGRRYSPVVISGEYNHEYLSSQKQKISTPK